MNKFAVISNNKVINIAIADSKEIAEEATKCLCVESNVANIGDIWNGTQIIKQEIEIPSE